MSNFKRNIIIFSVVFIPITFSLGYWQVDRAKQKNEIMNEYDSLLNLKGVSIKKNQSYKSWMPAYIDGEFTETVIFEDNAILNGKAGFKVYHLFHGSDDLYIFIHRGFVERNLIKNDLPDIKIPQGVIRLEGSVLNKNENSFIQNIAESDPRIIQEFSLSNIVKKFPNLENKYIHNFLFNLNINDENKFLPIEKPTNMTASKHIGYAIQWFGLCLALLVLTIYAYRRKDE